METPLLRVSRPVSACARCRNAKIRCDGKLPACSACERAGKSTECSSANDLFAKGKERSYVASLELRVEKLEKQIAQARAQQDGASQNQQVLVPPSSTGSQKRSSQNIEASDVDELVSDFGYLVLNATSTGYNGFDKEMSFARLAISTATITSLPPSTGIGLPARETALGLVEECIRGVFAVYPVLTETSIYGSVESMYQHHGQYSSPLDIWNMHLILAIGLLCRSEAKDDASHQTAARHVAVALGQAEVVLQPGVTITTQAILLLALYAILDPTYFSSWYLLSIAVRVWVDIGLHEEPAHHKRPLQVAQNHRRLFYCMYSLDRAISFAHVRLLSFIDDAVEVDLPGKGFSPRLDYETLVGQTSPSDGSYFRILAQFRQVGSKYYQRRFGSKRDIISEPWYSQPKDIVELTTVYSEMTAKASDAQKNVLGLDLHYLVILLLQPGEVNKTLDSYGARLLFDVSIRFAQTLDWLLQRKNFVICCSSLEYLRAIRVIRRFVNVFEDPSCPILEEFPPQEPPGHGDQLPSITRRTSIETITAAIDFCISMNHALNYLARRFGSHSTHDELIGKLQTRHRFLQDRMYSRAIHSDQTSHPVVREPGYPYQTDRWQP